MTTDRQPPSTSLDRTDPPDSAVDRSGGRRGHAWSAVKDLTGVAARWPAATGRAANYAVLWAHGCGLQDGHPDMPEAHPVSA
ncbi:hypothetical protein OG226_08675 [Streptomyces sp. NBC_01261]|uniref:hypothetical protein n=1 Tax=Streptomyces sp. NBC_01261 TaxID=2903802 RepID=UPI002E2F7E81|nr:hypothetical protein [Streptomyces sp. NBC_01261]